jgi:hypothetical protein
LPYGDGNLLLLQHLGSCCCADVSLQAVVKEGTGGAGLLVVKLSVEKTAKGNPDFARHLLGLPEIASTSGQKDSALAVLGGLVGTELTRADSQV